MGRDRQLLALERLLHDPRFMFVALLTTATEAYDAFVTADRIFRQVAPVRRGEVIEREAFVSQDLPSAEPGKSAGAA